MEMEGDPGLVRVPTTSWRRIPWGVPEGRKRLRFWSALPGTLLLACLFLSFSGAQIVGYEGFARATAILGVQVVYAYVVAAIAAVAYGLALLATAVAPRIRLMPRAPAGLTGNTVARIWYGLAYLIPPLIAWGVSFTLRPTETTGYRSLFWLAAPLIMLTCVLFARSYSNRDAKRAVLAGQAPTYEMSPDGTWWRKSDRWASVSDHVWWNGSAWTLAEAEAPEDAVRTPDGHYWWSGSFWCPMPPLPKRTKQAANPRAATF
ncbi:MAG: hypothetical protein ABSC35_12135 [Candidatus Dormibacteria bacterium]